MDVVIVGAGIVGLATAYALSKAGRSVTVVERGPIPNPLASSCDHHRLIRITYPGQPGYTARMADAFAAWRSLWDDLGPHTRYFADTGILTVSSTSGDYTDRAREVMDAAGLAYERIDGAAAIAERFGFLETTDLSYALLTEGGALMANRILADLADWLRRNGAVVMERSPVAKVDAARAVVTLADGRTVAGEKLVVAAGVETRRLVPALGNALAPHRSLIVYAEPPADLAAVWAGAPCWNDLGGDTDLWGMPPIEGLPAKLGNGAMGRRDADDHDRTISGPEMEALVASYRSRFREIDRFTIRFGQANYWTHAPQEEFVLHEDRRMLVVSACSGHGFKFGALSGRDVADAIGGLVPVPQVAQRMAGQMTA